MPPGREPRQAKHFTMQFLIRFFCLSLWFGLPGGAFAQAVLPPAAVGTPYSYQVSVSPTPPPGAVYTATGLPAGLGINASTGLVSGTASSASIAAGTISVTSGGLTNTFNFTLVVGAPTWSSNPTGADTGAGSWSVSTNQFLAARFTVAAASKIVAVRAEFANATGTLFAAVVPLSSLNGLPAGNATAGTPFAAGEAIASTSFTVPAGFTNPIVVPLNVTVPPGVYGVIFGTGQFGATGSGSMRPHASVSGASSFYWYINPSPSWRNVSTTHFKIGLATVAVTSPVISAISAPRQVVDVGQSLTLNATAAGADSYQWKRNGRPIAGATTASYTITGANSARDTGWYQLVAANGSGVTTSAVVFVNVTVPNAEIVEWGNFVATPPPPPSGLGALSSVVVTTNRAVALKSDGTVVAWGFNGNGESTPPTGLGSVVALSACGNHTLALKADGTVVGWGENSHGQATMPAGVSNVVAIAAGGAHSVVLKADGTVIAWGWNANGQAVVPGGLNQVVAISANLATSLALRTDGAVFGWGSNLSGEITIPGGLTNVATPVAGGNHSMVLKTDGTVFGWGSNTNGQLNTPPGLSGVVALVAGDHNVALKADGSVVAWGYNGWGQTNVPAGLSGVVALACSGTHNYALRLPPPPASAPLFTLQPGHAAAAAVTGSATFQADASGMPVPTFRWQRQAAGTVGFVDVANTGNYSGTTTKSLVVSAPTPAMNGDQFRCVATNSAGIVTSLSATLSVINLPVIATQPVSRSVVTGQSASFTVSVAGEGPFNYMWRRAGFMIPGAGGATLTLPNVTRADADDYDVVIFPSAGGAATTSTLVSLQVAPTSYPTLVAPDPTWNLQPENDTGTVATILRLADGRAYVGGAFLRASGQRRTSVLRLTEEGALDPSFVPPELDGSVSALSAQADGKLVITGAFTRVDGVLRTRVARLGSDGRVDPTFNVGGVGPNSTPLAVTALPDGNIVLGGGFSTYNGTSVNRLAWLDARGVLLPDARNDPAGGVTAPVNVLLALPGGRLAVGGNVTTSGSTVIGGLAVLRPDGTPDPAFNVGIGGNEGGGVFSLALQPDGKIIAGGTFTTFGGFTRNRIVRLLPTGAVDTTFDAGTGFTSTVRSLALQSDGRIVAAGSVPSGAATSTSDLARLTPTGARDPGFVVAQPSSTVNAVALQTDGRVLIGGTFVAVGAASIDGLARLGTDGARDAGFDLSLRGSASIGAMALLPNGQVVIARSFTYLRGAAVTARMARFNADGTRDGAFNVGGAGADNTIFGLVRTPDGKIVIGGSFANYNGAAAGRLVRLNADGSRDTAYNSGGTGFNGTVNSIVHLLGGGIAAGGVFTSYNGTTRNSIALLDSQGNLISSFAPVLDASVDVVAKSRDGSVVVGGGFSTVNGAAANRLARLTLFGALDPEFNVGSGPNGSITAIGVLPDNRLIVGGTFTVFNGANRSGLVRLTANGSVDASFAPSIIGGSVYSLHLQEDGKVIVRGTFTSVGGQPGTTALARINNDGTVDPSFRAGGIVSSAITNTRMMMRDDGSLFVPAGTTVGLQVTRPAAAPMISSPPTGATVGLGASVTLTSVVTSAAPAVYQWYRDQVPVVGANSPTLALTGVTTSHAGNYTLEVKSEVGTAVSPTAVVAVITAPRILSQFQDRSVGLGGRTAFQIFTDSAGPTSYEWRRNGMVIPGATSPILVIPSVATADAGSYAVAITNASGSITSASRVLTVLPNPLSYSSRHWVAPAGVTAYFSIAGSQSKRVLLRAVGPTYATFGVSNVLVDPRLSLWRANGALVGKNDNWGDVTGVDLPAIFAQVGAFGLPAGSKDAVIHAILSPGSYAVRLEGHTNTPGAALLELFDLDKNPLSRLAYVGVRGETVSFRPPLMGGLTMTNSADKRLLIRAVGPTLSDTFAFPNPTLEVLEGTAVVANNSDWSGTATLSAAAGDAGAFALPTSSLDAALLLQQRIGTGAYTAQVLGPGSGGDAMLEFYDLPATGAAALAPLVVHTPRLTGSPTGAPLTLRPLVIGTPPLSYQWRKDGTNLPGATNPALSIAAAQATDAGVYQLTVTSTLGTAHSLPMPTSVGHSAVHVVLEPGYSPGDTITVMNVLGSESAVSVASWSVTLPPGWSLVSSDGGGAVSGETGTLGWAWGSPSSNPISFSYTVRAPLTATGPQTFTANAELRRTDFPGAPLFPIPSPSPLVILPAQRHSADTDRDFQISLFELTRVIELYNTRSASVRTGAYVEQAGTEDGFTADTVRLTPATHARFHSADTRGASAGSPRDGMIDLFELTRMIELYNAREGTVRTGRYRAEQGTEDGFAAGP